VARLELTNVSVHLPVFGADTASLRKTAAATLAGGRLGTDTGITVVRALDDVSIRLKDGDRLGVYGPNGAGKTTLLRTMAGFFPPKSGTVLRQGSIASLIDPMGGMEGDATGYENIQLRCLTMRMSPAAIARLVPDVAEFSELGDFLSLPVRSYSTGMVMRLGFSIATSVRADIVLLDEWLSVGDADFRVRAEQRMRELVDNAGILVLATHAPDLIRRECNQAMQLKQGRKASEQQIAKAAHEAN
jgi:lipopolysaccharide transport system ATP-binding protein